jgi:hypothetical protein
MRLIRFDGIQKTGIIRCCCTRMTCGINIIVDVISHSKFPSVVFLDNRSVLFVEWTDGFNISTRFFWAVWHGGQFSWSRTDLSGSQDWYQRCRQCKVSCDLHFEAFFTSIYCSKGWQHCTFPVVKAVWILPDSYCRMVRTARNRTLWVLTWRFRIKPLS